MGIGQDIRGLDGIQGDWERYKEIEQDTRDWTGYKGIGQDTRGLDRIQGDLMGTQGSDGAWNRGLDSV